MLAAIIDMLKGFPEDKLRVVLSGLVEALNEGTDRIVILRLDEGWKVIHTKDNPRIHITRTLAEALCVISGSEG